MSTPVPSPSTNGMIGSSGTFSEPSGSSVIFVAMSARAQLRSVTFWRRRYRPRRAHLGASATNARGFVGAAAVEEAADQRAADDHAVAARGGLRGLRRGRDADAEQHRQVGDGLEPAAHLLGLRGQLLAFAGDAEQRHAVDEALRDRADRARGARRSSSARRGARSRRRSARAASAQPSSSSSGRSGRIAAATPDACRRFGEALVPGVRDEVVVRHHDQRHGRVELGELLDDADRCRAEVERALRRFLDRAAVHDRVGERDADLDRVGAAVDRPRARRRATGCRARR